MSTSAQIAANQANSQHSTGPVTEAGKAASSQNNFRHGLRAKFQLLSHEDPEEFTTLSEGLFAEHQPTTCTETMLVERMIHDEWRSRRVEQTIDRLMESGCDDHKLLAVWLRYQISFRRSVHKCLADILRLKADRRRDQIGFERQKIAAAAEARKLQVAEARIRVQNSQIAARELASHAKSLKLAQLTAAASSHTNAAVAER